MCETSSAGSGDNEFQALFEQFLEAYKHDQRNGGTGLDTGHMWSSSLRRKSHGTAGLLVKAAGAKKAQDAAVWNSTRVKQILSLLQQHAKPGPEDWRINYDGFLQACRECKKLYGYDCDRFLRPDVFLRFELDGHGAASLPLLAQYVSLRISLHTNRALLSRYDEGGGTISEGQLEDFICSTMRDIPALASIPISMMGIYKQIYVRKFMFMHGKNGQMKLKDVASSSVLQELHELQAYDSPEEAPTSNWFSQQSARRVHNTFLALDKDMNGTLSLPEFACIGQDTMSKLFIECVFQEHVQRRRGCTLRRQAEYGCRDEMELVDFVDFVLAWDNRHHPAAIPYFFSILDLKKQGYINHVELYTFFREIHAMWINNGEDPEVKVMDVIAEIIDIVQPRNPPQITVKDLENCGMAGQVFQILADVQQFYLYNYRENFIHNYDSN